MMLFDDPAAAAALTGAHRRIRKPADAGFPPEGVRELAVAARERFTGTGVDWTDILVVSRLPALTKAGGSQKNRKRTNLVVAR